MNNKAIGSEGNEVRSSIFTPEQISASNLRVEIIGELLKARTKQGLTQKKLEELSGIKQPVIARIETGTVNPNMSTILRLLAPLGKTLYVGDLNKNRKL